jgi:isocitrate dehydrogenase
VGLAGSANIGKNLAMFEAIHGSAPRRAGLNMANPSGLILASVMMLVHIGLPQTAMTIHNAWLRTLEEGIHTYDIFKPPASKVKVGTKEFAQAVIDRLGQKPQTLKEVHYTTPKNVFSAHHGEEDARENKVTVGVDIYIDSNEEVEQIYQKLAPHQGDLKLKMISNRGVRVWPEKMPETSCGDAWRCRFVSPEKDKPVSLKQITDLLQRLAHANIDFVKTEHLCSFNGVPGYTLAQDEQ